MSLSAHPFLPSFPISKSLFSFSKTDSQQVHGTEILVFLRHDCVLQNSTHAPPCFLFAQRRRNTLSSSEKPKKRAMRRCEVLQAPLSYFHLAGNHQIRLRSNHAKIRNAQSTCGCALGPSSSCIKPTSCALGLELYHSTVHIPCSKKGRSTRAWRWLSPVLKRY
jgi:hypothetical protein